MSKARLGTERMDYDEHMRLASQAEAIGDYAGAIGHAIDAWDHVDAMMKYERKYEEAEFKSVPCVDTVVRLAPFIFDIESLESARTLLKEQRSVERHTSDDLGARVAAAIDLMWEARRLWSQIESNPGTLQGDLRELLGGDQDMWRSLVDSWETMGAVIRTKVGRSHRLRLATDTGASAQARCSRCSTLAEAERSLFYAERTCQACGHHVMFVISSDEADEETRADT